MVLKADLFYFVDTGFWSTLKKFCASSQVPILLTCNSYNCVTLEMLSREPVLSTYKTIHLEDDTSTQALIYFRVRLNKLNY